MMEEAVRSGSRLDVSVSFGRFEKDALSWEKWSSFSPNKYLEEAGNLSTPGSVAQKKAYFEAHYKKKIAAKKAEELELEPIAPSPDMLEDVKDSLDVDNKFGGRSIEEAGVAALETLGTNGAIFCEEEDDSAESHQEDLLRDFMNGSIEVEEKGEDLAVAVICETENSAIEEPKDELNGNAEEPRLDERKESPLVESPIAVDEVPARKPIVSKRETSKLKSGNVVQKGNVTSTKKEIAFAGTKKKVVSPSVKPLPSSRYSRPSSTSVPASASKTLKKPVNESPPLKSKSYLVGESKRTAPSSMHMSLSLSSSNSLTNISMTRKSLIMEKMGDKDIVRRAFKTFQNRGNGSTTVEKPSPVKHISPTSIDPKISTFRTPTKASPGPRKAMEKQAAQKIQPGTKLNPTAKGLHKIPGPDKKNTVASSPTTGLKSDEKTQKRKEFLKKLEAKSIARGAEKARVTAKSEAHVEN